MNVFEIKNAQKAFDGLGVLRDISLGVKEGEVVSILGPSGSGKSTLLRCATFLETLDCGTVSYMGREVVTAGEDGRSIYDKKRTAEAKRCFGLVFQNFNLFPHYSVLRNIYDAPVKVEKRPRDEAISEAMALLEKIGLADKAYSYPCQLSGGQQQRVSIARALAMNPGILFFDEPTSALDPEITQEVLGIIRSLAAEKMTMVIVTHEIAFARNVSDRVVFMDGGVIVEEGPPEQVIDAPRMERTRTFLRKFGE